MDTQLNSSHQITYDAVFEHPVAQSLTWLDVRSMLVALADVVEEDNDVLRVERNGKTLVLRGPLGQRMGDIETQRVRDFLKRSTAASGQAMQQGLHLVVVIDDRRARVYRTMLKRSVPQRITPYHPAGLARHLEDLHDDFDGDRTPAHRCFYKAIAKTLVGAETILVLGSGADATTPMRQLLIELGHHHREVAQRIIGAIVLHEPHLTEDHMLDKARAFYAPSVHSF